jgi:hypothetical protein
MEFNLLFASGDHALPLKEANALVFTSWLIYSERVKTGLLVIALNTCRIGDKLYLEKLSSQPFTV